MLGSAASANACCGRPSRRSSVQPLRNRILQQLGGDAVRARRAAIRAAAAAPVLRAYI